MHSVSVVAARPRPSSLVLEYWLLGDLARLAVPERAAPRQVAGLWQHTCFEAFVRQPGAATYLEFNFSPSGEWAAWEFTGYRAGMGEADCRTPRITTRTSSSVLAVSVAIGFDALRDATLWQLALAAVIESEDGTRSYWALAHPTARPDFHHADAFNCILGDEEFR